MVPLRSPVSLAIAKSIEDENDDEEEGPQGIYYFKERLRTRSKTGTSLPPAGKPAPANPTRPHPADSQ